MALPACSNSRDAGFFPEAMFNFLALLGWSLDDKTTIISQEELIENFSIDRMGSSASVFDRTKLEWMNGEYLRSMSMESLLPLAVDRFQAKGVDPELLNGQALTEVLPLGVERARTLD